MRVDALDDGDRLEVLVVGSGPGGALTATLLAEAGLGVTLVEEGEWSAQSDYGSYTRAERIAKYRHAGLTASLGPSRVAYVEGCCVGGGSEINSGLYHRTPKAILERWVAANEIAALHYDDLVPLFEANEADINVTGLPGRASAASSKLAEGANALGWSSQAVPRWFRYDEPYRPEQPTGVRQSMTETFIPRFLQAGGRLVPNLKVVKLASRQGGAPWEVSAIESAGVNDGRRLKFSARYVFLACGSIQTAAVLRRSGIRKNVGNSLRMHPTVKVVARFEEEVNNPELGVPVHQVKQFSPQISFGCSVSTLPYLAIAMLSHPRELAVLERDSPHLAVYYVSSNRGRGWVRSLPGGDPLVFYHLDAQGGRDLAQGIRNLSHLLFAAGATMVYPVVTGQPPLSSETDLYSLPGCLNTRRANLMTIHLMGSCPMGENRRVCAVDSFGRVHGHDGLYVSDGSVLGGSVGANPQGTIMALARRTALSFIENLS